MCTYNIVVLVGHKELKKTETEILITNIVVAAAMASTTARVLLATSGMDEQLCIFTLLFSLFSQLIDTF